MSKDILTKLENIETKLNQIEGATPLWLTIDQLSDYINLSKTAIRKMIKQNEIPHQRAGSTNKLLFNRKKIDLWLLTGDQRPKKRARKLNREFIND
ncbi:MAG: excisionase family DNA-binding protein [Candidatus Marinimicrobia bacterium]|nr:excisionase family DNA-binding protein [Candidatus Neomarinimicrobiota bacterium]